ncbi:CHAT domain-containing protein [Kribbella sp. NBC_00482]|uniref:hypothetical protein n=1 Tax=Kribbella sp. NBC_00482 TaxID=2975968 RepID=UPI002E1828E0
MALAVGLFGVLSSADPVQVMLLVTTTAFLGVITPIALGLVAGSVFFGVDQWWYSVGAFATGWWLIAGMSMRGFLQRGWQQRGPILGFLPVGSLLRLFVTRRLSVFATVVDLAVAGDSEVAPNFVAVSTDLPSECEPVLDVCRALVALHSGDIGDAVSAVATARAALDASTDQVRGWCTLQLAVILRASGRDDDARAALTAARSQLVGHRARQWRRRAELLSVEADVEAWLAVNPDEGDGLSGLLRAIHRLRWIGVRRHDSQLIERTEFWLARLMIGLGELDSVRVVLRRVAGRADGRVKAGGSPHESAAELVLRASLHGEDAQALAQAREDASAALALLDANTRPLAAVRARLVLAELDEKEGRTDAALGQAIAAVSVANRARYQLPSSRWRSQWALRQLDAYAVTLRLADRVNDSRLVAEIIEMARGEVLPAQSSAAQSGMLSILDLTSDRSVAARAVPDKLSPEEAADAAVLAGFNPVVKPAHARVGFEHPWPAEEGAEEFDLNRELIATAGRCWYWNGVTVADRHYWSVRSPDGIWSHGMVDLTPGGTADRALSALRLALPLPRLHEDAGARRVRATSGVLWHPVPASREIELLDEVARAFLPGTLRDGLLREGLRNRKLLVSMPASLSYVPFAWLPLSTQPDIRLVERVAVQHVPAWAVLRRASMRAREPLEGQWPVRLAVINPSGDPGLKEVLHPPRDVMHVSTRSLTKPDFAAALESVSEDRDWLLYVAGHLVAESGKSSLHGLSVAGKDLDGVLTMRDLASVHPDGRPRYPLPSRTLVVACDGIGLASLNGSDEGDALANEWLGFSAGLLMAGADHICCTAYPVLDDVGLRNTAHILARELTSQPDPCLALAEFQRRRLARWRLTGRGTPLQWQSFVYLGRA